MQLPALARGVFALLLLSLLAAFPPHLRADDTWVEVQSPHFTVLSNGSRGQARDVALGFEQVRAVFSAIHPTMRMDASAEDIVFAVKNEDSFAALVPFEASKVGAIAGQFSPGWETDYIFVRLDAANSRREVVYHEYIHKLLGINFARMPEWLDEGLAEFFGSTRITRQGVLLGAPSQMAPVLRTRPMDRIDEILAQGPGAPLKNQMFEPECWALTHFLMLGPGMGTGQKMTAYLALLQKGADSRKAFVQIFGDPNALQPAFNAYVTNPALSVVILKLPVHIDASQFSVEVMTPAERDAELGGLYTRFHESSLAESRLNAALAADPQSALAHRNLALHSFDLGKDEDAKKEFDRAAALDPKSYLALYYQAMLAYGGKTDADSLGRLDTALEKVSELNPLFAPALVVRSQIRVRQGKLQEAADFAQQSRKLEPDRAGYATNLAAILYLGRDYKDAAAIAENVAAGWLFSDRAEALAVLKRARIAGGIAATAAEQAQEAAEMQYAAGLAEADGVIQSVTCEADGPTQLTLQTGQKTLHFQEAKLRAIGFSDTLWYGEDHFSICHHVVGLNAIVRYTAPADSAAASDSAAPSGSNARADSGAPTDSSAPLEFKSLEIQNELVAALSHLPAH